MHKGDGPKLPYQAVVIRQSAMHRQGRNAIEIAGGVDSHASSGPVPVSVCFFRSDIQSRQNSRQHVANGLSAPLTPLVLFQHVRDDFRFVVAGIVR